MPTFILAGFPRALNTNLREALSLNQARLNAWTWELVPGCGNRASLIDANQAAELCALSSQLGGAPIFGVSEDSGRGEVASCIEKYFRFRWILANHINLVARKNYEGLITALVLATLEEDYWNEHVRPSNFSSPLMLPEQFSVANELQDTWRLSRSYNNIGHLHAATKKIARFNRDYRKKVDGSNTTPWVDRARWVWEDNGARHGAAAFPEDWKYSFRIPDGHHFDVTAPKAGNPKYLDATGKYHSPNRMGYWNVTAHGNLRGS